MDAAPPVDAKSLLEIGYIAKAHGLQGELGVRTYDPGSQVLDEVSRMLVRPKSGPERVLTIESVRETPKELLVVCSEVHGRTQAENLVGAAVFIFREELEEPAEGEFFQGDLIGLLAEDEQGQPLGKVEALWETGPVPNLVIRAEGREELVIPFADEFVPTVDVAKGRIVVRLPEFLE